MPNDETVNKALAAIKQPAAYEYFFEQLNSPTWISPLRERGFFVNPPPNEVDGEYVSFPFWPESRYLARMAPQAPELVMQTLQNIPDTDNPRVLGDMIDALLEMPPKISAQLAKRATSWVGLSYLNLVADKLGKYVIHLATGGYPTAAFNLARALLMPIGENRQVSADSKWSIAEARPRYDIYTYQRVTEAVTPTLSSIDLEGTLRFLTDLLDTATTLTIPSAQPPDDLSSLWRHSIENSDQNSPIKTVTDILIDALRDAIESCVRSNPSALSNVIALLDEHSWNIFSRLSYHTLRTYLDTGWDLAHERIFDRNAFGNVDVYHEFWLLARSVYPRLSPEEQKKFISLIEKGPPTPYENDPDRSKKIWIVRRLATLKEVLDAPTREKLDLLVADLGFEPEHPEFLSYTSGMWSGPTSPLASNELRGLPIDELIEFLHSWEPTGEFMSPSPEGLARSLSTLVTDEPNRYANSTTDFTNVDPIYIRGLIDGWTEAARNGKAFNWDRVLDFCIHITEMARGDEIEGADDTTQWRWVRRSITYLLLRGFEQEEDGIPSDLRSKVWATLEPLTRDVDPIPDFEEQYSNSSMGPAEIAINTTRGQAMHDVVRYGLWVARSVARVTNSKEQAFSFEQLPEVQRVLDERLDATIEPSPAVRSVYGQWILWLYMLDSSWVKQHIKQIFPAREDLSHLRDAAWNAYLDYSPINDNVFDLLRDEYIKAVTRIGDATETNSTRPWAPDARLGQHLMIQYLRDRLQLTDPLMDQFFGRAKTNLRQETLAHTGRVIEGLVEKTPGAVSRATALWEFRIAEENSDPDELKAFGWWFVSRGLSEVWVIQELAKTLKITGGQIDNEYDVLQRLAEIADQAPRQAVDCVRMMANVDRENIILLGSLDMVYSILETALVSNDLDAQRDALDLVHSLGARGYRGLRPLLWVRPPQQPSE